MGLSERLGRLEERRGSGLAPEELEAWPVENQLEDVIDALWLHRCGSYVYPATDRELRLMAMACSGEEITGEVLPEDLPEGVAEYFERIDPAGQHERERYLYERRRLPGEPNARERVCLHEERVRAFEEESRRRDRAMLEENRAACGLPPLTPERQA